MGGYEMGEMLGLCPPAGGGGIGWVLDGQTLTFDGQRDRPSNEGEHYSQNDQPTDRPTDRPTNRPTDQPTNRPTNRQTKRGAVSRSTRLKTEKRKGME